MLLTEFKFREVPTYVLQINRQLYERESIFKSKYNI